MELFGSGIHHQKGIFYKIFLDDVVERGVGWKTWGVVDLEKMDAVLVIDEEIEAQELEAHVAGGFLRTAHAIVG